MFNIDIPYLSMCMCLFVLHSSLLPHSGGRTKALISACKIDQADFTDWVSILPSNLVEEISLNTEVLGTNT